MIDPAAARDAIAASNRAVSHAACTAARRRRHTRLVAVTLPTAVALAAAFGVTHGRVPAAVSWLFVAAFLTGACAAAVWASRIWRRPCHCAGDTFLTWLGTPRDMTTTTVDAVADRDN